MKCVRCGDPILGDLPSCLRCGAPVTQASQQPKKPQPKPEPSPVHTIKEEPVPEKEQAAPDRQKEIPEVAAPSYTTLKVLAVFVGVILIIAIFSSNNSDSEPTIEGAAAKGDATAQYNLGYEFANGSGRAQNYSEAAKWYQLAADQGHARAQSNLGYLFTRGLGVEQNQGIAFSLYQLAAEQGEVFAQKSLGYFYQNGVGTTRNPNEAFKWYQLAAEQGDSFSQLNLGLLFKNGEGVTQSYRKAAENFRLATKQGNAEAQFNLALMYYRGEGLTPNLTEAAIFFRMAADQGDASSQYLLGFMYHHGEGVLQSDALAEKWYRAAEKSGLVEAKTRLEELKNSQRENLVDNSKVKSQPQRQSFEFAGQSKTKVDDPLVQSESKAQPGTRSIIIKTTSISASSPKWKEEDLDRLSFERPPIDDDEGRLLKISQIRWCLREEHKLSEAKEQKIRRSRLKGISDEYNKRCLNYSAKPSDLTLAQRQVDFLKYKNIWKSE